MMDSYTQSLIDAEIIYSVMRNLRYHIMEYNTYYEFIIKMYGTKDPRVLRFIDNKIAEQHFKERRAYVLEVNGMTDK